MRGSGVGGIWQQEEKEGHSRGKEKAWPLAGTPGCSRPGPPSWRPGQAQPTLPLFGSFLQRTYIFTFLLSSRVFIPPHDLLARVGQICLEQRQQLEAASEKVKVCCHGAVSTPLHPVTHARQVCSQ